MGNTTSGVKETPKLKLLNDSLKDMSFNVVNTVFQEAIQNTNIEQSQNIVLDNLTLTNCSLNFSQQAKVKQELNAIFISLPTSPNQIFSMMSEIINQIVDFQTGVVNEFLGVAKSSLNCITDSELKLKLNSILKVNIQSSVVQSCISNIDIRQRQNIIFQNVKCTGGSINVDQTAIVNSVSNCLFSAISNSISNDTRIKTAIRKYNGEYNKNYLSQSIGEDSNDLPLIINDDMCNSRECPSYGDCLPCPACIDIISVENDKKIIDLTRYIILIIVFFITATSVILAFL